MTVVLLQPLSERVGAENLGQLWLAVLGAQTVVTLLAVYGLLMTPLGWGWALFVGMGDGLI